MAAGTLCRKPPESNWPRLERKACTFALRARVLTGAPRPFAQHRHTWMKDSFVCHPGEPLWEWCTIKP
eukprot:2206125-Prymnesium_polylepis.1